MDEYLRQAQLRRWEQTLVFIQLEIFVTHLFKGRKALCCDLFLLLSQGIVYQVLKVVLSVPVQSESVTRIP